MQILSALDAVSPAFSRMKLVLFSPFHTGRTWKLAASAYTSRMGVMFLPFPLVYLVFLPALRARFGTPIVAAIVAGLVLLTLLYLWIFYLCSRLGFANFDVVLHREQFITPSWRKHGPAAFRWTVLKVIVGTILAAVFALPLAHYMQRLIDMMASISTKPGQPPSPQMMHQLITFYASFFLVYFLLGLVYFLTSLAADFVVPSLALEATTLTEAFRRFGLLFRNEPLQVTFYAIVKLGLGLAMYIGGVIALEIVVFIVEIIVGIVGFIIGFILHLLHVPTPVLIGLAVLAIIAFLVFIFWLTIIGFGAMLTFFEAYNLYFLGGRYPLLGDALDRSTPPPPLPYFPLPMPFPPS